MKSYYLSQKLIININRLYYRKIDQIIFQNKKYLQLQTQISVIINYYKSYYFDLQLANQLDRQKLFKFKTKTFFFMFQKQNLLNNFQLSYYKQNKQTNNIKSPQKVVTYSQKVEYFSPRKKQTVQTNFNYNKCKNNNTQRQQTNKNYNSSPYEQSSQSYSQYYNQRAGHNNTHTIKNSISMGSGNSSHPSKLMRTQTSKNKLNKGKSPSHNPSHNLNQNPKNLNMLNYIDQQQQQNHQKLKQKYSSYGSSNLNSTTRLNQNNGLQSNNCLSNVKNTNSFKKISPEDEKEGYKIKLVLQKSSGIDIRNGRVNNNFTMNNKNTDLQKLELKQNFNHRSSNQLPQLKIRNGLIAPSQKQSLAKESQQMVNRTNLKTQQSKQKIQKYLKSHNNNSNNSYPYDHINQNSQSYNKTKIQKQHNNTNNNQTISFNNFNNSNSNNGYSRQGNSNNIRNNNSSKNGNNVNVSGSYVDSNSRGQQFFHQYAVSPSQEYYSRTSDENLASRNSYHNQQRNYTNLRSNRQNHHSSSSSTVNTQNRKTSSLSFDKFAKKKMLTFYQCQAKKYYQYNDQGYLTDRQIELRQKIQKAAFQALDKIIIQQQEQDQSQSQVNRLKKSKSQGQLIKLNKLKQQVNTQRKRLYQLYGKYQIQSQQSIQNTVGNKFYRTRNNKFQLYKQQKQKSYNPSQLPPSSSLSKKKFIVKYKQDQNQNILGENQLLDDSYYQREQKSNAVSGGNEIRLGVMKKKQSKRQPNKRQNAVPKIDNDVNHESFLDDSNNSKANNPKSLEYYLLQNIRKSQLGSSNRLNPNEIQQKRISRSGGITSEEMLSSSQKINGSNNPSQKSLQQLSQQSISSKNNSDVNNSQNDRKKNPSNKDSGASFSQSFQSSKQSESYCKNTPQSQNSHQSSNHQSQPRSYSQKLQNLDMINSKFKKKSPRTQSQNLRQYQEYSKNLQQKSKGNLQIDSSLKLKTNTDKVNNKKQGEIKILDAQQIKESSKQNPSLTLEENFDEMYQEPSLQNLNSQDYLKKSVQQRSVKSSHIGLVQQKKLKHKSSKNSHSSKHGSQSAIQAQIQKKSAIKKWVRQSSSNLDQNSNEQKGIHSNLNMKKYNKISLIDNIPTLKQSSQFNVKELKLDSVNIDNKNLNNSPNNRFSLDKNNRLSFESGSINLNLQSAIHLHRNSNEKYLKSNNSKIEEKGQSKLLNSRAEISENKSISSKKDNKQLSQKKKQNIQLSRLAQERESFRSKAYSRHSSKKSNISKKINIQKYVNSNSFKNQQKYNIFLQDGKNKYATLLNVNSKPNAQKINNVSNSKLTSSQKVKKSSIHSHQNQRSQRSINDYYNSSLSNQQNLYNIQMISFNLIQRAQQLLDFQDQLHEKRKQLQNSQITSQQFQDILAKIQGHIYMLRQIAQIATTAADIYSQDSTWVIKSSFLSLKKYFLQKQKIVQCALGLNKKCCFKLSEYQLANQDLKQVINHQQIQQLIKDLTKCNQMTQKFIQQYYEYLKQVFDSDFIQDNNLYINLKLFDDRTEIGVLLEEYKTEILALKEKTNQSSHTQKSNLGKDSNMVNKSQDKFSQQQSVLQQQTEERMKKRIFKLMEVGFLLSELTGNRIKVFTQQIDVNEEFQQYFNDNWPYFERIVKTFS